MKTIDRLLYFAKAIFFLVLSVLLILLCCLFGEGGATPVSTGMYYLGLFLAFVGILFGVGGFFGGSWKDGKQE